MLAVNEVAESIAHKKATVCTRSHCLLPNFLRKGQVAKMPSVTTSHMLALNVKINSALTTFPKEKISSEFKKLRTYVPYEILIFFSWYIRTYLFHLE